MIYNQTKKTIQISIVLKYINSQGNQIQSKKGISSLDSTLHNGLWQRVAVFQILLFFVKSGFQFLCYTFFSSPFNILYYFFKCSSFILHTEQILNSLFSSNFIVTLNYINIASQSVLYLIFPNKICKSLFIQKSA